MKLLLQLISNGVVNGSVAALLALGFGLVYRSTRIFHIALGAVYTMAAYGLYVGTKYNLFWGIFLGMTTAILLSLAVEKGVYRPFVKKGSSLGVILIASLGIYIIVENLLALIFGNEVKVVFEGVEPSYTLGPIIITRIQALELIFGSVIIGGFYLGIKRSRWLKALWAMGEEPELLSVLGWPVARLRELAFVLSALVTATASMLVAYDLGTDPHGGLSAVLTAAVAVLVGGRDSLRGWVATAFLIALIQNLVMWKFSARWNDAITFLVLIAVLLFRPQGLFAPEKRVEEQ